VRAAVLALLIAAAGAGTGRAGVASQDTGRWRGGAAALVFDAGVSENDRREVRRAARAWNAALGPGAGIRFDERSGASGDRVLVLRVASLDGRNRCRATVGRSAVPLKAKLYPGERLAPGSGGEAQGYVVLSGRCSYRSLVHELGHVLGLRHEHERTDRDAWVSIRPAADREPDPLLWRNYVKRYDVSGAAPVRDRSGIAATRRLLFTRAYDPCSVMQYVEDPAHARRGVALSFTPLSRRFAAENRCPLGGLGGRVSSGDVRTVLALYGGRVLLQAAH